MRKVLAADPRNPLAAQMAGVASLQGGSPREAVTHFESALLREPNNPRLRSNLGNALRALGLSAEALAQYDQAIELEPLYAEAHFNRGCVLEDLQRRDEALASYERAVELKPEFVEAHNNRGIALAATGQPAKALEAFEAAIRWRSGFVEAHFNRGNALKDMGRLDEALAAFDEAIRLNPQSAVAHYNRGNGLVAKGLMQEAVDAYDRALACNPRYADALANRGAALNVLMRPQEALQALDAALSLKPDNVEAHSSRGTTLKNLGRLQESIQSFQAALALRADHAASWWNLSLSLLLRGDLEQGWPCYEWRWKVAETGLRAPAWKTPPWRGELPVENRRLLLYAEQGIGDTFQFCRYAAQVKALGAQVILAVPAKLHPVLQGLRGVDVWSDSKVDPSVFDLHCPLLSLPMALGTTLDSIPADVPYLKADPQRVRLWSKRLGLTGFRIGICWQGSRNKIDAGRSFALREFEPLATVPGVRLISLHRGEGEEQLQDLPSGMTVENLGSEFDAEGGAFMDTAAVMMNCDLVITSDTAVAHLAGALGVPVWVVLKQVPDWRWMMDRPDSPWYPTMRLFRQERPGDWGGVFARVRAALQLQLAEGRSTGHLLAAAEVAAPTATDSGLDGGLADPLQVALSCIHQGRFEDANAPLRRILARDPRHFDALHLQGVCRLQLGDPAEALVLFEQALAVDPRSAEAHANRGAALSRLGRVDAAIQSYDHALQLRHDFPDVWFNRGNSLRSKGLRQEAIASYDKALGLRPNDAASHSNRGVTLLEMGRELDALTSFDRALTLNPDMADVHSNRSAILQSLGRSDEAKVGLETALKLNPDYPEAWNNLGNVQRDFGDLESALRCYDRALELRPNYADAQGNRAVTLKELGRIEEAMASCRDLLSRHPDLADPHWNLSLMLLLTGDLAAGWAEYEWRWQTKAIAPFRRDFRPPMWSGAEPLEGKTILLHAEQGLGDAIQFCRYAPLVKAMGATVVLEIPAGLVPLMRSLPGVDCWVAKGQELPEFDLHCPLMSLPLALGPTLQDIPATVPYLKADAARVEAWGRRLGTQGLRIGICWQGSRSKVDAGRSLPLRQFEALASVPGVRLISLHRGDGESQLSDLPPGMVVETLGSDFDAEGGAFMDTAAVMMNCDLVITSDTAVAHLAGALGRPVWVLLKSVPDWRWLLHRADSPWYPTMRLFRQSQRGDWASLFQEVVQALEPLAAQGMTDGPTQRPLGSNAAGNQAPAQASRLMDGSAALARGDYEVASKALESLLASEPDHFDALHLLGVTRMQQDRLDEAVKLMGRALGLNPDSPEAHSHLGIALKRKGRIEAAIAAYGEALRLRPDFADALYNCSIALKELGRIEEALARCDQAIRANPSMGKAFNQRGTLWSEWGRYEEAEADYREALRWMPHDPDTHNNLANALKEMGRLDEAILAYREALALQPEHAEAEWNLSLACLLAGDFREGLPRYESRWRSATLRSSRRDFACPLWIHGQSLVGKTILLHAEQGLGDAIQFCRYAAAVKALGAEVLLEAPATLIPLLKSLAGVDRWLVKGESLPAFDFHSPLASLPLALGTTLETIPGQGVPYLRAQQERVQAWARRLGSAGLRVGICWQGSRNKIDMGRSFALRQFAPLAALPGVRLISLHRGAGEDQLKDLPPGMSIETLGPGFDLDGGAFMDTAAVMMNCDLVITSDTAVAHLAGALGVPVWVLLKSVPDWRWLLHRDDSPWYPTMRLFRQQRRGDWDGVFARVTEALSKVLAARPQPAKEDFARLDVARVIDDALSLHRAGRVAEAMSAYDRVLAHAPDHFEAVCMKGVALLQSLQPLEALERLDQAVRLEPHSAFAHAHRGNALRSLGRMPEALESLERATALRPDLIDAVANKASVLDALGRHAQALATYDQAILLRPSMAELHHNRAICLRSLGQAEAALEGLQRALELEPARLETLLRLGAWLLDLGKPGDALLTLKRAIEVDPRSTMAHHRSGDAYKALGQLEDAENAYRAALALNPGHVPSLNNLGAVLRSMGRFEQALDCYDQTLRWVPDAVEVLSNRLFALRELGRLEEACACGHRVLALKPDWADGHRNLGAILCDLNRYEEALDHLERALKINPLDAQVWTDRGVALKGLKRIQDSIDSHDLSLSLDPKQALPKWNRAVVLLLNGDFDKGWRDYEARWTAGQVGMDPAKSSRTPWTGAVDLAGRTILLHAEQGLGDTIQFCRFAQRVKALGATVVMEVQGALLPLLQGLAGVDRWVAAGQPLPAFDEHCPLMSLPLALGLTTQESIPAQVPYLKAQPQRVQAWGERLGGQGMRIGICWQGSRNKVDVGRSFALRQFEPVAAVPGVRLISLHRGEGEDQLGDLPPGMVVETLGPAFDPQGQAFLDTAAVMMNCDLVITSDTAVAHLAGALGVPVWVVLKQVPDWRWMLDRPDSPWYPTMRLFRQQQAGDWGSVFADVAQSVQALITSGAGGSRRPGG